jgi:hypothetical protein
MKARQGGKTGYEIDRTDIAGESKAFPAVGIDLGLSLQLGLRLPTKLPRTLVPFGYGNMYFPT